MLKAVQCIEKKLLEIAVPLIKSYSLSEKLYSLLSDFVPSYVDGLNELRSRRRIYWPWALIKLILSTENPKLIEGVNTCLQALIGE